MSAVPPGRVRAFATSIAGWIVAAAFLFAGVSKLFDINRFAQDIGNYRMLPDVLTPWLAVFLPPLEIVLGACLVVGVLSRGAALVASVLLALFVGAMAQAISRGINLECGCFGTAAQTAVSGTAIVRNLVLMAFALVVVFLGSSGLLAFRRRPQQPSPPPVAPAAPLN